MCTKLNLNSIVIRNKNLDTTSIENEIVMMNLDKGTYYGLNGVGSRIWEIIDESKLINGIVSILTAEYNVEQSICEENTIIFLNRLYEEELIYICG